jgi:signal peptidase II
MDADPRGNRAVGPASTRWLSLFAVGLYIVVLDQLTKDLVRATLSPGEGLPVFGSLSIQPFRNPGIAGGALAGDAVPAALVATLAVAGILAFLARHGAADRTVVIGFGLLIGGGIANLLDRLRFGYVTDFIVQGDRAFNLADVAILAGTMLVIVSLLTLFLRMQFRGLLR